MAAAEFWCSYRFLKQLQNYDAVTSCCREMCCVHDNSDAATIYNAELWCLTQNHDAGITWWVHCAPLFNCRRFECEKTRRSRVISVKNILERLSLMWLILANFEFLENVAAIPKAAVYHSEGKQEGTWILIRLVQTDPKNSLLSKSLKLQRTHKHTVTHRVDLHMLHLK